MKYSVKVHRTQAKIGTDPFFVFFRYIEPVEHRSVPVGSHLIEHLADRFSYLLLQQMIELIRGGIRDRECGLCFFGSDSETVGCWLR